MARQTDSQAGVPKRTVSNFKQAAAVKADMKKTGASPIRDGDSYNERLKKMLAARNAGKNGDEIGAIVGLSRRRVNEIFKAHFDAQSLAASAAATNKAPNKTKGQPTKGTTAAAKKTQQKAPTQKGTQNKTSPKRCDVWGFTTREYDLHVGLHGYSTTTGSPMYCYGLQRSKYKARGFDWRFSFKAWWEMWVASGRWNERGPYKFVLDRKDVTSKIMDAASCHVFYMPDVLLYSTQAEAWATRP